MEQEIARSLADWIEQQLCQDRFELEQRHQRLILDLRQGFERIISKQYSVDAVSSMDAGRATPVAPGEPHEYAKALSSSILHGPERGQESDCELETSPHRKPSKTSTESRTSKDSKATTKSESSQRSQASIKAKRQLAIHEPSNTTDTGYLRRVAQSYAFETFFAMLILANAAVISAEVQVNSYTISRSLGISGDPSARDVIHTANDTFAILDYVFGILFWIELLCKLVSHRAMFFRSAWDLFDTGVMISWSLQTFASARLVFPPTVLRVFKVIRLLRLVRLFKGHEFLDSLVLMISTIKSSMSVLLWSTVLLFFIVLMSALILNNMLEDFLANGPTSALNRRKEVFLYFGSFTRSMLTLFEMTLGNWVPPCRTLMENVAEWYGLVFIMYKLIVGFAVLKCITAIFLCETMKCLNSDDDMMIDQKMRAKRHFIDKMTLLLAAADDSGNGCISREEFIKIMTNERVQLWLQAMELNIREPVLFFDMIDDEGDGELNANELITGMAQLRGPSTQISLKMGQDRLFYELSKLRREVQEWNANGDNTFNL